MLWKIKAQKIVMEGKGEEKNGMVKRIY